MYKYDYFRSVRCLEYTWIILKRCKQMGLGLRFLLKSSSLLSRPLGRHYLPSLSQTLASGIVCHSSSSLPSRLLGRHYLPSLSRTLDSGIVCHSPSCLKVGSPVTKTTMDTSTLLLVPPQTVSGMVQLDRGAFIKKITVPKVTLNCYAMKTATKLFKKYLLKIRKYEPVKACDDSAKRKEIVLNPVLVKSCDDIQKELLELGSEAEAEFAFKEITVNYENWHAGDILKAVLPTNQDSSQGYSIIGHILHLNLREHLLPYKTLIGQVYLDKIPNISMVVNKLNTVDTTYRTFQMEVLAGSGETVVTVAENGCSYMLDFAKVFWNPRLSTEHSRVVEQLSHGDVLYDVMAGGGPFAIPAARSNKCHVLANDLNPDSFKYLVKNCSKNKVVDRVRCHNMDGHEFIKTVLKTDLLERWKDPDFCGRVHVTMNLPGLAVTFLPSFRGLMCGVQDLPENVPKPVIHVYMFTQDTAEDTAIGQVAENLGYPPMPSHSSETNEMSGDGVPHSEKSKSIRSYESLKEHVHRVIHVRQVAPNKAQMRVTFELPLEVLMEESSDEPLCKKIKSS